MYNYLGGGYNHRPPPPPREIALEKNYPSPIKTFLFLFKFNPPIPEVPLEIDHLDLPYLLIFSKKPLMANSFTIDVDRETRMTTSMKAKLNNRRTSTRKLSLCRIVPEIMNLKVKIKIFSQKVKSCSKIAKKQQQQEYESRVNRQLYFRFALLLKKLS